MHWNFKLTTPAQENYDNDTTPTWKQAWTCLHSLMKNFMKTTWRSFPLFIYCALFLCFSFTTTNSWEKFIKVIRKTTNQLFMFPYAWAVYCEFAKHTVGHMHVYLYVCMDVHIYIWICVCSSKRSLSFRSVSIKLLTQHLLNVCLYVCVMTFQCKTFLLCIFT